jgi:enoyl-CoA hydratase
MKTAAAIAAMSLPAAIAVKEAINRSFEVPLAEGLRTERRLFESAFTTEDQKEGMAAFIAKRPANFKHR